MTKRCQLLFILLLASLPVWAHDSFEGTTTVRLRTNSIDLAITLNSTTAMVLCDGADLQSARFSPDIFEGNLAAFKKSAGGLLAISVAGNRLVAFETNAFLGNENDVEYRLRYPRPAGVVTMKAVYLERLPREGYGAALTILDMENNVVVGQKLLMNDDLAFETPKVAEPPPAAPASVAASAKAANETIAAVRPAPAPVNSTVSFGDFLKLGIEHILTGYDHLLFLCGLLVVCRKVGPMLAIITCFTLAHSLTLALAALDLVQISPRLTEPLIAATIVFVGVENFRGMVNTKTRCGLALGFGLIHGFGFATALRETGLGGTGLALVKPLFAFNLGVECGQLAVAVVFLPVLFALRKIPWFARYGTQLISAIVVLLGGYWLLDRTVFTFGR